MADAKVPSVDECVAKLTADLEIATHKLSVGNVAVAELAVGHALEVARTLRVVLQDHRKGENDA